MTERSCARADLKSGASHIGSVFILYWIAFGGGTESLVVVWKAVREFKLHVYGKRQTSDSS